MCVKRNATRFLALQPNTNSFNKKGKQQTYGHHKMGFAQNSNKKNMNMKPFPSLTLAPPNQMLHCPQWGLDWSVREGSATFSMCSRWKVILILGRLRCCWCSSRSGCYCCCCKQVKRSCRGWLGRGCWN